MAKRKYKTIPISRLNISRLVEQVGSRCIFGIDVAKTRQVGAFASHNGEAIVYVSWDHPAETKVMLDVLKRIRLAGTRIEVAMEPTGSYSDTLLYWLVEKSQIPVYRVQGKSTKDGREIYDGVASSHDPKAAGILCWLHSDGLGRLWRRKTGREQDLRAATSEVARHNKCFERLTNKIEALLARCWPELCELNMQRSITVLRVLAKYGSPKLIGESKTEVAAHIRAKAPLMKPAKVSVILNTCKTTLGLPVTKVQELVIRNVSQEAIQAHERLKSARKLLEELVADDAPSRSLSSSEQPRPGC